MLGHDARREVGDLDPVVPAVAADQGQGLEDLMEGEIGQGLFDTLYLTIYSLSLNLFFSCSRDRRK